MEEEKLHKILFKQMDDSEDIIQESMWAKKKGAFFQVENIPFYIREVAYKDIVEVAYIDGEALAIGLIEASGNSTVRIYFDKNFNEISEVIGQLANLTCSSEVSNHSRLISVNIPKEICYSLIKKILEEGEENGYWEYEEGCLAHA